MYEKFYRSLYKIRRVEEKISKIYPTDKIKSPIHLSIGQEAVSVGVCEALRDDDIVFGTHRGHALYLAKGGDLKKLIAELYGKATGITGGKGGSMHLIETKAGLMGTSAIVGTTIPEAVGYAYALKLRDLDAVVAVFFGDGAVDEGVFHESMNFAALKRVPVVFICENNQYAVHSHQKDRQAKCSICDRARVYGIPARRIDANDVFEIHSLVKDAVDDIRDKNSGPRFFECMTYRWKEHVGPGEDFDAGYRERSEAEPWFENDQVKRVAGLLDVGPRKGIEKKIEAKIREAFEYAEQSSFPEEEELYTDVFKEG